MTEGRTCPLAYRYRPEDLCSEPETPEADVFYLIGGLYGNPYALDDIERMAVAEERQGLRVKLVFNGDFNWFNASDSLFREINSRVLGHTASLGNVEYELANPSDGAGCGCAYPDFVDDAAVARSNAIMERLQGVAAGHPDLQQGLAGLPRYRCLLFAGLRILVLHGDPESLAGWGLAHESMVAGNQAQIAAWFRACGADVIASSHTCLPALWSAKLDGRPRIVANNGSAGMANLHRDRRGLITRIALTTPTTGAVATVETPALNVSLMAVTYDTRAWLAQFDSLWPTGSAAAVSYRQRIRHGTGLSPERLVFRGEG